MCMSKSCIAIAGSHAKFCTPAWWLEVGHPCIQLQQHDQDAAAGLVQVVKNKCAPPFKAAEFDIMFGSGISSLGCLLDAAEGVGIV